MEYDKFWVIVGDRVSSTIQKLESGNFLHNLVHLTTVYGVASVAYYAHDNPLMSDETFDQLCKHLDSQYAVAIMQGASEEVLDSDSLTAGTGFHLAHKEKLGWRGQQLYDIYDAIINGNRKAQKNVVAKKSNKE